MEPTDITVQVIPYINGNCLVVNNLTPTHYLCSAHIGAILVSDYSDTDSLLIDGQPTKTFKIKLTAFQTWLQLYQPKPV